MQFSLDTVNCVGCCGLAPVITVGQDVHGKLKQSAIPKNREERIGQRRQNMPRLSIEDLKTDQGRSETDLDAAVGHKHVPGSRCTWAPAASQPARARSWEPC